MVPGCSRGTGATSSLSSREFQPWHSQPGTTRVPRQVTARVTGTNTLPHVGVTQEEHLGSKAFPSAPKHRRDSSPVSNSITHATKSIPPWLFLSHPTTRDTTAASERPGRPQSHVLRFREALPPWEELFLESSLVARANSERCDAHHPPGRVWCASQERGKELRGGMTKQGNVRNQTKCQAAEKNMATASISAQLNSYVKQAWLD